jgi:8-amino-7-oxononanoate synthase
MTMDFQNELDQLDASGLRRFLFLKDAVDAVNFSSNDYLGLSHHPKVQAAAIEAIQKFGTGGASSRLLAGTLSVHSELENSLASFLSKEAALVYSSGYHTNTGILPVLAQAGDVVFVDRLSHASLLDGIKLSSARFFTFDHNDMDDLERLLKNKRPDYKQAFVVTEGIFSMDGDTSPIKQIISHAHAHAAFVYLDEAHSFGLLGKNGQGLAAQEDVLSDVDILVGTLSKVLGSQGGFVAGSKSLIDLLISRSRSFLFTTALAPSCAAAAAAALRLLPDMDGSREKLMCASQNFQQQLIDDGYTIANAGQATQIIPVWTGDVATTKKLSDHLLSKGFFVPSIRPPTVPRGEGRVRLSITTDVMDLSLKRLTQAFQSYAERPQKKGDHRLVESS